MPLAKLLLGTVEYRSLWRERYSLCLAHPSFVIHTIDREIEDTVGNHAASLLISPTYGNAAKAVTYGWGFLPSLPIGDHDWATLHSGGL
jgi:hypothetical protein